MSRSGVPRITLAPGEIIRHLTGLYGWPVWRPHGDALSELILTVLSQNTSDANSGRAFMRLRSKFPTWEALIEAPVAEIETAITVGGLARVKAPRIKAILTEVRKRRGSFDLSFLRQMPLTEAREWLCSLPGVGPKTAACVLMFALGLPAMPVDTHVHRVAQRLGLLPAGVRAGDAHEILEPLLDPEQVYPLHVLLIRHGRRLCRARRPLCSQCPLLDGCPYGQTPPSR